MVFIVRRNAGTTREGVGSCADGVWPPLPKRLGGAIVASKPMTGSRRDRDADDTRTERERHKPLRQISNPAAISCRAAMSPARRRDVEPVLFVVDHEPMSLDLLVSGLARRFGKDFTVRGESSQELALVALQALAASDQPVALLFVDDAASGMLVRAHRLHPWASEGNGASDLDKPVAGAAIIQVRGGGRAGPCGSVCRAACPWAVRLAIGSPALRIPSYAGISGQGSAPVTPRWRGEPKKMGPRIPSAFRCFGQSRVRTSTLEA